MKDVGVPAAHVGDWAGVCSFRLAQPQLLQLSPGENQQMNNLLLSLPLFLPSASPSLYFK